MGKQREEDAIHVSTETDAGRTTWNLNDNQIFCFSSHRLSSEFNLLIDFSRLLMLPRHHSINLLLFLFRQDVKETGIDPHPSLSASMESNIGY